MAQTETPKAQEKQAPFFQTPLPTSFAEWLRPETWTRFSGTEAMAKTFEDQLARMGSLVEELGKTEKVALDQAHSAVQELSRLTLAGLDYTSRVAAEMRRSALEGSRRGLEMLRSRS